ncbi:MAG: hypothetical protein EOP88_17175 [Verrucomicrobiaceae bacterium]|nr:MAG: hypothetical protein EOP88_17175 [Verrucomicrobiaceae bacterium]
MSNKLTSCPKCRRVDLTPEEFKAHKCSKQPKRILVRGDGSWVPAPDATAVTVEVVEENPRDPRFDLFRLVDAQTTLAARLFLRGQVKLGMILIHLKKEFGRPEGRPAKNSADSAKFLPWDKLVEQETGYSRRQTDEFIRLFEGTRAKLKKQKKLNLPAVAKKDAIVLFQTENPLALSEQEWEQVDAVIGSLTTGETQAGLLQHLKLAASPAKMPKPGKDTEEDGEAEVPTAGQLAFHFFDGVAAPLINARTSPDYRMLLMALPSESTEEGMLSLATLEAEARAFLADIEEAKQATAKPARGRAVA